jgi:hypothetical protein
VHSSVSSALRAWLRLEALGLLSLAGGVDHSLDVAAGQVAQRLDDRVPDAGPQVRPLRNTVRLQYEAGDSCAYGGIVQP